MKKIVVAGGGVLGSQIAFQAAYCGFDVTIWLRSQESIGRTAPKLAHLKEIYTDTIRRMAEPEGKAPGTWAMGISDHASFDMETCLSCAKKAAASIRLELDLGKAVENADLYVNGVSDPESIDKAWTLGTGSPKGPFRILDTVGLTTAHNIVKQYLKVPPFLAPYHFRGMDAMLQKYLDAGKLGESSGEGFYQY